ncbi:MAG TPA: hypothetical protein VFG69_05520 [Nannocystaceae bacterium]|nr:hypothetical protein [Nannocystaceae bacterium]
MYARTSFSFSLALASLAACHAPDGEGPGTAIDARGRPLGPMSREIALANTDAAERFGLLARVELQPGELLEFYEPVDGMVVVSGAGAPVSAAIVGQSLASRSTPDELWDLATDGAPMPERLAAAIDRDAERESLRAEVSPRPAGGGASPAADVEVTSPPRPQKTTGTGGDGSSGWCDQEYFSQGHDGCDGDWDWQVCLFDWWNGAYAYNVDVRDLNSNICSATGSVLYKVQFDNGGDGSWTVDKNRMRWWSGWDFDCEVAFWDTDCPYFRVDVQQATNDRFHLVVSADE